MGTDPSIYCVRDGRAAPGAGLLFVSYDTRHPPRGSRAYASAEIDIYGQVAGLIALSDLAAEVREKVV